LRDLKTIGCTNTMSDDDITKRMSKTQISLRDELLGRLSSEGFGLKKREVSVMTRMNADIVEVLDALVELAIFKSRSEAVAALVELQISSRRRIYDEIKTQAHEIVLKRESARKLAYEAMRSDSEE
jgi:Arc/MetJ-type ribon-helix-helix transcriptional regulator